MGKKKTHEEYIAEVKEKFPQIEVLGEYKDSHTKILHKCKNCGNEWLSRPTNILRGHLCWKCASVNNGLARRKTHEEFLFELSKVTDNIEILDKYNGIDSKIKCRCLVCDKIWETTPYVLLTGCNCPRCSNVERLTHDEFIENMKIQHPNIQILSEFKGINKKINCKCNICDYVWSPIARDLKKGKIGCPKCAGNLKRTHEDFIQKLKEINPTIEILNTYVNSHTKVKCRCLLDNFEWEAIPNALINQKTGCPKCANQAKMTHLDFIKKFECNGNKNVDILSKYIDSKTYISCKCKICGNEWKSKPNNLLYGYGCMRCSSKNSGIKKRKTDKEFKKELKAINPDINVLSEYIKSTENVECECKKCNKKWNTTPTNLLSGHGCPFCTKSLMEKNTAHFLSMYNIYYIQNYKFVDLKGTGDGFLSYDFYLPNSNVLIECQGKQHEKPIEYFGGEEQFKIQQEHDRRKHNYAKLHNIQLLEIWYYDIDNIESILLQEIPELQNNLKLESVETVTVA